ncbi:MAG: TolC family protein [Bacteroidetes bacterium]|nr:TolC family protein [Bacteroidota bacterium]MBT4969958.1 TolC family protein [Bacteroidota bacterium]MBT5989730.1 TolC family protein [Bacteroidota bacterium]MBT7826924.1 TolC family protein [Bacteroidota bacterium]MBT7993943.1 TolC family protein [Bacteroidota bacterium]
MQYLLIALFTLPFIINAQNETISSDADEVNEVSQILKSLPPLHVLIDSAIINSPLIKFQDAEIMKNQYKIRLSKTNWTRNFGLSGDVVYGTYDALSWNPNTGTSTINTQVETRYGTGLYIRLPLSDALNRKSEIGIAEVELLEAKIIKQQREKEITQLVIEQYNRVILNERLVSILNKNKQALIIQKQLIEKQFTNGQIRIEEYAQMTELYNNAVVGYEQAKAELTTTYLVLQEIVGIKFQISNLE